MCLDCSGCEGGFPCPLIDLDLDSIGDYECTKFGVHLCLAHEIRELKTPSLVLSH